MKKIIGIVIILIALLVTELISAGMLFASTGRSFEEKKNSSPEYSLCFATFLGQYGGGGFDIVSDRQGFVYVAGATKDPNFPSTPGAYQGAIRGDADAFVAKFSPEGKLVFSTLIGGSKREHHVGLTIDNHGNIYLVGGTHSADFPVTPGTYDTTFNGEKDWGGDVYVAKLDSTGSKLLFSTFLGGSAQETASSICLDKQGNILVGGTTLSSDFPTTEGAYNRTFHGFDAFVAKLNSDGTRLMFSTLLGGKGFTNAAGIALDEDQNIYLCGSTNAPDFPVTTNAFKSRYGGGKGEWDGDGFLAKLSPDGAKLLYLTYLGGNGNDFANRVVVGRDSLVYIAGMTTSQDYPVTKDAIGSRISGKQDAFITVFEIADMKPVYSTFLGGSGDDIARNIFSLGDERIVVSGETDSPDFPFTKNDSDGKQRAAKKIFVSVLNWKTGKILYSMPFACGASSYSASFFSENGDLALICVTDSSLLTVPSNVFRTVGSGAETFVVGRFTLRTAVDNTNR